MLREVSDSGIIAKGMREEVCVIGELENPSYISVIILRKLVRAALDVLAEVAKEPKGRIYSVVELASRDTCFLPNCRRVKNTVRIEMKEGLIPDNHKAFRDTAYMSQKNGLLGTNARGL